MDSLVVSDDKSWRPAPMTSGQLPFVYSFADPDRFDMLCLVDIAFILSFIRPISLGAAASPFTRPGGCQFHSYNTARTVIKFDRKKNEPRIARLGKKIGSTDIALCSKILKMSTVHNVGVTRGPNFWCAINVIPGEWSCGFVIPSTDCEITRVHRD